MKEIELTQGYKTIVDDEDYDLVSAYKWRTQKGPNTCYAKSGSDENHIFMHRLIMGLSKDNPLMIDHKNRNGLDNTRKNLRKATPLQNSMNRSFPAKTSKYKGVHWDKARLSWVASCHFENGQQKHLGVFEEETEAAKAYDSAVLAIHGEFAYLNFPETAIPIMPEPLRNQKSKYKGVTWVKGKWTARIMIAKQRKDLGFYDNEENAARAYDNVSLFLGRKRELCNFPNIAVAMPPPPDRDTFSKYPGTSFLKESGKWQARIRVSGKQTYIGVFIDEKEAFLARQNAYAFLADYGY
jgi:hypothetical protein